MYVLLTVGGNEKGAREGAALEIFFFALWATILYLLIAVLETARFSVDETLQVLVLTSMPSVVPQCSLILRDWFPSLITSATLVLILFEQLQYSNISLIVTYWYLWENQRLFSSSRNGRLLIQWLVHLNNKNNLWKIEGSLCEMNK